MEHRAKAKIHRVLVPSPDAKLATRRRSAFTCEGPAMMHNSAVARKGLLVLKGAAMAKERKTEKELEAIAFARVDFFAALLASVWPLPGPPMNS